MPLILPKHLINADILESENIFTIDFDKASTQDIRPLKIAIVNLMPTKEVTELQFIKMLSNTALQIHVDLIKTKSYIGKHDDPERLATFYKTYDDIKNEKYDAMIITGAPVEKLEYNDIIYWNELKEIFDYAKNNVHSTLFICWAAQAALHHYYNINAEIIDKKIFGIYEFINNSDSKLLSGFDDTFFVPHSRYTRVTEEQLKILQNIRVLSTREDTGVSLASSKDGRFVFNFGHWEYDKETLHHEYLRDKMNAAKTEIPQNYYINNTFGNDIKVYWKSSANLFFSNWLNYCVYQKTPFEINNITANQLVKDEL